MADSTLNVTITEDISLNGHQAGSSTTKAFIDINEFSRRTVSVTTSLATFLTTGTVVAAAQYVKTNLRYIRVTNLDPTNYIQVGFIDTSGDAAYFKVGARESFLIHNDDIEAFTDGSNWSAFSEWDTLSMMANTATCDVELVVAST